MYVFIYFFYNRTFIICELNIQKNNKKYVKIAVLNAVNINAMLYKVKNK